MFSRAIRQSSRRVAAISASSRIASVSPSNSTAIAPASPSRHRPRLQMHLSDANGSSRELGRCWALLRWSTGALLVDPSTNAFFCTRPVPPSSAPQPSKCAATHPSPKPPRPRSRRFSSRGSAASRRRAALPRPGVSSPSGTLIMKTTTSAQNKG
jgi:hypothetical protein